MQRGHLFEAREQTLDDHDIRMGRQNDLDPGARGDQFGEVVHQCVATHEGEPSRGDVLGEVGRSVGCLLYTSPDRHCGQ